ncbi:hypothetical protein [Candidatus Mycoplasma haematohominis]|uniref:Uncharacterized protein n=1 Tax=Candidatus Mycoplasma haematohominis TaxID=1494318 RepID=A0A478FRZ6_9MOLU|nr:hypothetical protein [Candidatus Mycoplasma haemohominis]GCE63136.1 hypothetical protein MHSWG343_01140 [Candidatus Mycoplasma haemohominis]
MKNSGGERNDESETYGTGKNLNVELGDDVVSYSSFDSSPSLFPQEEGGLCLSCDIVEEEVESSSNQIIFEQKVVMALDFKTKEKPNLEEMKEIIARAKQKDGLSDDVWKLLDRLDKLVRQAREELRTDTNGGLFNADLFLGQILVSKDGDIDIEELGEFLREYDEV